MNEFRNKKVLVTGGTGLIGRQVVDLLVQDGADLTVASLDELKFHNHGRYFRADLRDIKNARLAVQEQEYIFHLAGVKSSPKITTEQADYFSDLTYSIGVNIIQASQEAETPNVLFTSSIGAYAEAELLKEENAYDGEAMDAPGEAKRKIEKLIQSYGNDRYKIVRIANCYGIGDNFDPDNAMFIPSLMAKVLRGDNPVEVWGDGTQVRDFIYSKDAARGIILMMLNAPDSSPVNLGRGVGYTVKEVLYTLSRITKFKVRYDITKPAGVQKRVMDVSMAKSLGFEARCSLGEGLKETWEWLEANPEEYKKRVNYFAEK